SRRWPQFRTAAAETSLSASKAWASGCSSKDIRVAPKLAFRINPSGGYYTSQEKTVTVELGFAARFFNGIFETVPNINTPNIPNVTIIQTRHTDQPRMGQKETPKGNVARRVC